MHIQRDMRELSRKRELITKEKKLTIEEIDKERNKTTMQ